MCADDDERESVNIVGGPVFATAGEAEAAGVAWASNVGVERLFVTTGTIEQPLELMEMDKPL